MWSNTFHYNVPPCSTILTKLEDADCLFDSSIEVLLVVGGSIRTKRDRID